MLVDATGKVAARTKPEGLGFGVVGPATLAYRAIPAADGTVIVVHQQSSDRILGSGAGSYYGGSCGGAVTDTYVSTVRVPKLQAGVATTPYLSVQSQPLGGAVGPLDVAVGTNGKLGLVATGNSWKVDTRHPTLGVVTGGGGGLPGVPPGGCWDTSGSTLREGEPVAIAFDSQNRYVVQYREPAKLVLETTDLVSEIRLSAESRADTGLAMFYMNASGGVSCASCHPEGGVDGHVWNFDVGQRTTQPLEGQISKRAPFHWSGDLGNWTSLVNEVMMKRMSLPVVPSTEQNDALLGWLDTIPARLAPDGLDAASIERGRAVFQDGSVGCAACHSGAMYTDNIAHQVGTGGAFVTPSLLGAGSRSPLMHTGCAVDVRARFSQASPCGGGNLHGNTASLTSQQVDDLVSFVRSL
jgi:mono/diheme cytochrome c family protein